MKPYLPALSIALTAVLVVMTGCSTMKQSSPKSTSKTPDASSATSATSAGRPSDAVAFNGHWYRAFDEDIPWHDAKKRCETMGGYLVCIETEAEQEFITKLCEDRYLYLGATDEVKEDTWVWVNGSKWEYTAWMSGQPNNYGGDENYLATYDGGEWVDVAADGDGFWMPTGFICEWEK